MLCEEYAPITFPEYSSHMHKYSNKKLKNLYKEVFHKDCTIDLVWAKYQISYELARQQDIKNNMYERLKKGSAFREAYKGTMACDLNRTSETLRTMIPFEQKYKSKQEITMTEKPVKVETNNKETTKKGVTLNLTVPETWISVFKDNAVKHLTDEQISKFMHEEFPHLNNKAFDTVHACRNFYNRGGYTKGEKPTLKSVRYLADGSVWKRGSKSKGLKIKKSK